MTTHRTLSILLVLLALFLPHLTPAQVQTLGQWQTLPNTMPINPVHIALMHNGKVLIVSGSGNLPSDTNYSAGIFDPSTGAVTVQPIAWDMFCNGMIVLPDGRPFVMGGTLQYDPFHGQPKTSVFDPATGTFADLQNMAHGRWYPTATTLADGRVLVFSGLTETGGTNTAVELYTVGSGWSQQFGAPWTPPLYPRMHVLPNGEVFYSGSTTGSRFFDPSTQTWSAVVATTNFSGTRTYGTSVLLPLTPANGYTPKVIIMGGGNPATNTTELIDLSAATPKWTFGPPMSQPRIEMNATILPTGKIIALGGSTNDEDVNTASLNADLYDPATNTFSSAGANAFARLYHSNSMLLPDATVLVVGGNPARGTYEPHIEVYSPAYLFNSDGTPATRPTITSIAPSPIGYGTAFQVQTPNASSISSVVLIRAGAVTHAFDMDQRLVGLNFSVANSSTLNVTGPPNGSIAPPGYYLLFILNSSGVPSVAQFVQISPAPADQPPTASITDPASDQIIVTGQSLFFAGAASDPDGTISSFSWNIPGGTPTTSALATPGNVTFSTPGTYVASLTVTDNAGLTNLTVPTRSITVENQPTVSSLSLSPSTVTGGTSSQGTVTLTAPAPSVGVSVGLASSNTGAATVLASVNIPGGAISAAFPINTSSVSASTPVTITATYQGSTTATLTVNPVGTSGTGPLIDAQVSFDQASPSLTLKSPAFSTTSGNESLLALIATDYTGGANTTVAGVTGAGLTWVRVAQTNAQSGDSEIWRAFATSSLTGVTVTATLSQSVVSSITIVSFSNVDPSGTNGSGAVGAIASGSANSGAPSAKLLTTRNNSLVLGVGNDFDNAIARTVPGGQSLLHQYLTSTGDTYWMQRQNAPTPLSGTTVTINDTAPIGDRYNLSAVEILPPAVVVPTYTVSGSITPTPGGATVNVALTGAASANTTTDSTGAYFFKNLPNGNYTVTPTKPGYTFLPANLAETVSGSDVPNVNFTAQAVPTYTVSGTITPLSLGANVKVNLSGPSSATTTTDSTGMYKFPGLVNGSYTVTPSQSGLSFTPPSAAAPVNNADVPNINFSAQTVTTVPLAIDAAMSVDKGTPSLTVATAPFSTTSGNELLLAFVSTDYVSGPNTTVATVSGGGLTWALVVRANNQSGSSEIWRAFAPSSLTGVTVTATLSQSVVSSMTVVSFTGADTSGINGSGSIGASSTGSSASGAPKATLVTTRNGSWVFGVGNDFDNAIARTPATGQLLLHQYLTPTGDTYWAQRLNATTPLSGTSVTVSDTAPTGDQYNLAICEILPAP